MHFYQKNIGDFNNATRHLTRVERSLFSDAIELYYDTEKPLTSDINKLNRLLLAHSQEEKDALLVVLAEFFTLTDEGYFNKRCNEEIVKYQSYMESKSKAGKASAEQRAKHKATGVEQVLNTTSTKQNQEPITNNHKTSKALSDKSDVNATSLEILEHLNTKAGRKFKSVKANISIIAARLKEFTKEELIAVVDEKCKAWASDEKMVAYLRPETLFNATKCAGYVGSLGAVLSPTRGKPWYISSTGISEKGKELGIEHLRDENPVYYKERVYKAAGVTPEMVRQANIDYGAK